MHSPNHSFLLGLVLILIKNLLLFGSMGLSKQQTVWLLGFISLEMVFFESDNSIELDLLISEKIKSD